MCTYYFIHHETLFIYLFYFLVPGIDAAPFPRRFSGIPPPLSHGTAPADPAAPRVARSSWLTMSTQILLVSQPIFIIFDAKIM